MKHWYTIQNREGAAGKPAEVSIQDEIGFWGVTAKDFERDLKGITADVINVSINSPGGSVFDGLAIFNMLRASGKVVNTNVLGIAASIASVIQQATANGGKRTMPANAMVMVHSPWTVAMGNAEEFRETADVLDKISCSLVGIYMRASGKSEEDVRGWLSGDTFMSADEALAAGLVDEITDSVAVSASFDIEALPASVRAVYASALKPKAQDTEPVAEPAADPVVDTVVETAAQAEEESAIEWVETEVVEAEAAAEGLGEFAAHFALNPNVTSVAALKSEIKKAKQIKGLCALAKKADMAGGMIRAGKSIVEVRAALTEALAEEDEATNTSNVRKTPPKQGAKPESSNVGAVIEQAWEIHKQMNSKEKSK